MLRCGDALQRGFIMNNLYLSFEEYQKIFPDFPIDESEFGGLSQAADDAIDALITGRLILAIRYDDYYALRNGGDADFVARMKKIIAQEIQVLYQGNGLNATTGGADAGELRVIDGVPFGQYVFNSVQVLLRKFGLMSRVL